MKRINIKFKVIGIYLFIILLCIIGTSINYNNLYNKVTIIDDKETTMKKINMSIPVKIEFYNDKLGSYTLQDDNSIKNIWSSINEITSDYTSKNNYISKDTSSVNIKGSVYYLNGTKDDFEISNVFKLNNYVYYDNYKLPIISNLKSSLLNYLYSPFNLGKFISDRSKVIFIDSNNNKIKLGNSDKEYIKNIVEKSTKIEDDRQVMALTGENQNIVAHIKVYVDQEDNDLLKVKSYNVMTIDVYDKNFFVAQYMGDENGRHIYMKGNLKDICKRIEENHIQ